MADNPKLNQRVAAIAPAALAWLAMRLQYGWQPTGTPRCFDRHPGGPPGRTGSRVSGAPVKSRRRFVQVSTAALGAALHEIPGVIEHGLFYGLARAAIIGSATGVRILGELP